MAVSRSARRDPALIAAWRSALGARHGAVLPAESEKKAIALRHKLHVTRAAERDHLRATHGPLADLDIDQLSAKVFDEGGSWFVRIYNSIPLVVLDAETRQPLAAPADPYREYEQESWKEDSQPQLSSADEARLKILAVKTARDVQKFKDLGLPVGKLTPEIEAAYAALKREQVEQVLEALPAEPEETALSRARARIAARAASDSTLRDESKPLVTEAVQELSVRERNEALVREKLALSPETEITKEHLEEFTALRAAELAEPPPEAA